jgi:hypothetical protein
MNELEQLLRRYRPSGPPAELRDRITAAAGSDGALGRDGAGRRVVPGWLAPALAAAAMVVFYALAGNLRTQIARQLSAPDDPIRQLMTDELAEVLGNAQVARLEAERLATLVADDSRPLEIEAPEFDGGAR